MLLTVRGARRRLEQLTWETDPLGQTPLAAASIRCLRIASAVTGDVVRGELRLQAAGLVYATLLALIPLLAVVFSVLKAFGVHDLLRPTLLNVLAPLGPTGVELTRQILDFVSRTRVGVLGIVGFGLLLYASVSLLRRIEQAVNSIWHVRRARRLIRRLSDYLAVILVGPLLFFLAVGMTASASSSDWFKPLHGVATLGAKSIPYVLIIGAHALIYVFVPNTRVRLRSALVGATVAGVLWQSVGLAFAAVVGNSVQYRAIYASLAILIFFMLWLYVSWLNVLIGATIAHYHQHPERIAREPGEAAGLLSIRRKERLGLLIVRRIGADYYAGQTPWTAEALARAVQQPPPAVEGLLDAYVRAGLLARTQDSPPAYLPARPIEIVSLAEIVQTVRAADVDGGALAPDTPVDAVIAAMNVAIERSLAGRSWRDLALAEAARAEDPIAAAEVRLAGVPQRGQRTS